MQQGLVWSDLSNEERDWLVAEFILQMHEDEQPRGQAATLLSAFQKISHDKYLVSWKVLSVWQGESPPVQAAAIDFRMAVGLCMAVAVWRADSGSALLLCLFGIHRGV